MKTNKIDHSNTVVLNPPKSDHIKPPDVATYTAPDYLAHPEDFCSDCGHPNVTWYAPNELWNKLCKREEIICPKCFQGRADKAGINLIFTTEVLK